MWKYDITDSSSCVYFSSKLKCVNSSTNIIVRCTLITQSIPIVHLTFSLTIVTTENTLPNETLLKDADLFEASETISNIAFGSFIRVRHLFASDASNFKRVVNYFAINLSWKILFNNTVIISLIFENKSNNYVDTVCISLSSN